MLMLVSQPVKITKSGPQTKYLVDRAASAANPVPKRKFSPSLMSELPDQTRDHPLARIIVWTAILAAAATFWFAVAILTLTWLRHA
jgi:hypothetical protein